MNHNAAPNLPVEEWRADIYRYPKPFDPNHYERLTSDDARAVSGRLLMAGDLLFFLGSWVPPRGLDPHSVWRSRDQGASFEGAFDVTEVIDCLDREVVLTASWILERDGVLYLGEGVNTIFTSTDSGDSWTLASGTAKVSAQPSHAVHLGDRIVVAWVDMLSQGNIQRIEVAADGVTFGPSVRLMEDSSPPVGEMSYDPVSGVIPMGSSSVWRNEDHAESDFTPCMRWPGLGFEGEVDSLSEWSRVNKVQHDPKYAGRFVAGGEGATFHGNGAFLAWTWDGGTTWENLSEQLGPRADRLQKVYDLRVDRAGRIFVVVSEDINST